MQRALTRSTISADSSTAVLAVSSDSGFTREIMPGSVPAYAGSGLLGLGPDLHGAEVVPVLLEPRLLERKDNPLAVTEVSVALTDDVGEMDEAAARDLWGVNSTPSLLSPSNHRTVPDIRSLCLVTATKVRDLQRPSEQ